MKNRTYWKSHYVLETDADEIERNIRLASFPSGIGNHELVCFEESKEAPNILISQGSGGHAYVFAELGYLMHLSGYNVFIMPKHGGLTISELLQRHVDAAEYITNNFNDRIGVFGEGLGGFVVFYLALARGPVRSVVCQNSPGILTEQKFQQAIMEGEGGAGRRSRRVVPLLRVLVKLLPRMKLPISLYLDWMELIDNKEKNRDVETHLVKEGYMEDPDFDKWYPLSAIMSLVSTPPPSPLTELKIPTMFMVAKRGVGGSSYVEYLEDLYDRLPPIKKRMIEVDGSVYWMLSHPREAAKVICEWFDETLAEISTQELAQPDARAP